MIYILVFLILREQFFQYLPNKYITLSKNFMTLLLKFTVLICWHIILKEVLVKARLTSFFYIFLESIPTSK